MNAVSAPCPAAKPASRREARRHSRRETILDVAAQWFLEHGYDGTTMSAIATALGGSKGTLWNYFPGSVAKIVKLEHAWRRLNGWSDDGFQVAPFPG